MAFPSGATTKKGEYSCRFYTTQMEEYRKSPPAPDNAPPQMKHIAGVMFGAFFTAFRTEFTVERDPNFESYAQLVFSACKESPNKDARTAAIETAQKYVVEGAIVRPAKKNDNWREETLEAIKADDKGNTFIEVLFPENSRNSLWLSVRDDGTSRNGLAEYACVMMMQAGLPVGDVVVVHIWDAAAMARGEMTELGRSDCSRSE